MELRLDYYYYIYSAMTQATGALIALVGIFIVYKLQIQRSRIEKLREADLDLEFQAILERNRERTQQEQVLSFAKRWGITILASISILFSYFVSCLHFIRFYPRLQPCALSADFVLTCLLFAGIFLSGIVLLMLLWYISLCVWEKMWDEREKWKEIMTRELRIMLGLVLVGGIIGVWQSFVITGSLKSISIIIPYVILSIFPGYFFIFLFRRFVHWAVIGANKAFDE